MDDLKPHPTPADLDNCRKLLAFLESSFAGSTIGGFKMDDFTASLRTVLNSVEPSNERKGTYVFNSRFLRFPQISS